MKNLQALTSNANLGNPSAASPIAYSLKDTFTTSRAAGSVNGTTAEPTGQTRTVTDTNSKISITGGALSFATGDAANDGVWYPSVSRVAGRMQLLDFTWTGGSFRTGYGTGTTTSNQAGIGIASSAITLLNGGAGANVGVVVSTTTYTFCAILRTSGVYLFIKGGAFTNWALLWSGTGSANTPLFPAIQAFSSLDVATADNLRIPQNLFLPTPLAYDTFTRANGAIGSTETVGPDSQATPSLAWTGSTFTISTNAVIGTPVTLGSELFTDPGIENWTNATTPSNWTKLIAGTSTVNQETSVIHGGTSAARLDIDVSNSVGQITQAITAAAGAWIKLTVWARSTASGKTGQFTTDMQTSPGGIDPGTTYTQYTHTDRVLVANPTAVGAKRNAATSASLYFDDFSFKVLTLSELFASVSTSTKDIIADINLTQLAFKQTQAGVVINLDSTSSPANFVIAYLTGFGSAKLDKCVGETYTNIISAAVTYVAGATLRVIKDGTSYQLFYNNLKVGATSTISDVGIISNTLHGLFSTDVGNTLDNFQLFPRGSTNNEYRTLDSY